MNELFTKNSITGDVGDLSLAALLEGCKKGRMKSVALRYGLKLSDKNTKQQMLQETIPAIESNFGTKLKQYSSDDLGLLLHCIRHAEIDESTASQLVSSAPFEDGGIYLAVRKDHFFPKIPRELAGKIMMHCATHYFGSDDYLNRTAAVCARIYGTFTPEMLANAYNAAFDGDLTLAQAERYLCSADSALFTYADGKAVCSFTSPASLSPLADSLETGLPTGKEIQAYAFYGLDANDYYYRQIVNFIYNNVDGAYDKADYFMRQLAAWCVIDGKPTEILGKIQQAALKITENQLNYLLGMIGELSDRTRKQSLKGNRHCDVAGTRPTQMPQIRATAVSRAKSEPIRVQPKIGRNDPCPCGSGKKYKKCCGKNQ